MIGRRSHDDAQSFEEALSGGAPRDEQIAELVRFAENLCEAAVVQPSVEFRESLRAQLMAEAATVLVPIKTPTRTVSVPHRRTPLVRRRVAGLTAALVASAGVVSLVGSSASAVPGDMLYPVKRSIESVELQLHRGDESRGSFQLTQASERLTEARDLSGTDSSDRVAATLDDFSSQAAAGSSALFSDYTENGQKQSIRKVNDFAATAKADLGKLSSQLPGEADDSFKAATDAVSDLATQASSLCASCMSAEVQSLVSAVTGLAKDTPVAKTPSKKSPDKDSSDQPDSSIPKLVPTGAAPTQKPAVVPTTVPTQAPSFTKPLIGALLGDDEQKGLVPGLLGGLLNGK